MILSKQRLVALLARDGLRTLWLPDGRLATLLAIEDGGSKAFNLTVRVPGLDEKDAVEKVFVRTD